MALPVAASLVEQVGGLTPTLFNFADQPTLDAFVTKCISWSDAWMQGHMGANYNLLTPAWAASLQEEGQLYLALEKLSASARTLKVMGTHASYISEEAASYQSLIETDWGERALVALDIWVSVEVGASRAFAMPLLLEASGMNADDKTEDPTFPGVSEQYSDQLDFSRGIINPDIGTVRR